MSERVSRPRVKPPSQLPSVVITEGTPLAQLFESGFSEHTVPVLWHRIQGRLHEPARRPRLPLALLMPLSAALAGALVLLGVWGFESFQRAHDPLRLSSGQLPAALVAEATPRRVELSDGSRIRVAQQSRLEVLSNDKTTFVTALSRGSATFEVNPKAERRWIVEVGLTSVEVVGTRFTVTRSDTEVNVFVEKGLVLVRGVAVPGGQQRLGAGQALRTKMMLEPPPPVAATVTSKKRGLNGAASNDTEATDTEDTLSEQAQQQPHEDVTGSQGGEARRALGRAQSGATPAAALEQAPSGATGAEGASKSGAGSNVNVPTNIEALLEEADRAREAGDLGKSIHQFEQVIRLAPRFDPRRGLAAMSVARMTMRSNPSRAAAALRATLDGMPIALQENAIARLVEAYAKSGQGKEAERMAERYLARFPNGRRAEDVRRWANP